MKVKISELPIAELPEANEFLAPVFLDASSCVTKAVRVSDLVEKIKQLVCEGSEVEVVLVEGGIKFRLKKGEDLQAKLKIAREAIEFFVEKWDRNVAGRCHEPNHLTKFREALEATEEEK